MAAGPPQVKIVRRGDGYVLLRNGQPYFVKGAVGAVHLEELVAAGGNSIRAGAAALDRAQALGLAVLVDLPFGKQRWGFDYRDTAAVEKQRDEIRSIVEKNRNHPAVLAWALGNELEISTTAEQRAQYLEEIDHVAVMIHQLDPRHPVITVVGGQYKQMLHEVNQLCPHLDAVGLNSYADMLTLPEDVKREGWARPYWITEFGPRGHWQVAKTPWGLPLEDSSTDKASFYRKAYEHAVAGQPKCLGSFVFHWAQHHEKTHTWYGMFLEDGSRTEAVDVMTYLWSGHWPANRAPQWAAQPFYVHTENGTLATPYLVVPPDGILTCQANATDPDGDPLAYSWDLRLDVSGNPNTGGDREEPTPPISDMVLDAKDNEASFRTPMQEGFYRLFAYVRDGHGNAAVANLPIKVEKSNFPPLPPAGPEALRFGSGLQHTMTLLATSTPRLRHAVHIVFYGQSLTKMEWRFDVEDFLRKNFPDADIIFENLAIGGYSTQFLKLTLPHDIFAAYPDLIIFHDFGSDAEYEQIIKEIRSHTTAEILIQNDRPDAASPGPAPTDPQLLDRFKRSEDRNNRFLPEVAARYGCELADVRGPYYAYLQAHGLKATDILQDGAHFKYQGDYLISTLTNRYLRDDPSLPKRSGDNLTRDYEVGRDFHWVNGKLELEFEGNRIDAIGGWGDPYYDAIADVRIDGQRPSERQELYHITRPSDSQFVDWPVVDHIDHAKPLLLEDWTLRVLGVNDDETQLRFEVIGSKTGPDGSGVSTERFVSHSGRVVIEPTDWDFHRAFGLSHKHTPVGFQVTWKVVPEFVEAYQDPLMVDRTREQVTTLALGLANTKHKLELTARGPNPPMIRALRVYRPPYGIQ
jgi:hypothetical protein